MRDLRAVRVNFDLIAVVLTGVYAYILSSLPIDAYVDRDNYLNYVKYSSALFADNFSISPAVALFNEPLWLLTNTLLSQLFDAEGAVRLIIFGSAFIYCWRVVKLLIASKLSRSNAILFLVVLLFLPQITKNYVIHLRQGFALAVFLLACGDLRSIGRSIFGALVAALIHSSFFLILAILLLAYIVRALSLSFLQSTLLVLVFGCVCMLGLELVASIAHARQSDVAGELDERSGLAFVFWLGIFIVYWLYASKSGRELRVPIIYGMTSIALYLFLYFTSPFAGRIFESCLPALIVVVARFMPAGRKIIGCALALLLCIQWSPLLFGGVVFKAAT